MSDARVPPLAAIVIAGGRGTRMGGIDKPGLAIGGSTLRERAMAAARSAGLAPILHLGPEVDGGPVAALAAGVAELDADAVVVLAGDLVHPEFVLVALAAARDGRDGAVLVDPDGREQWLAARYRVEALRAALDTLPDGPRDASFRALARDLDLVRVLVEPSVVADIDTWQDYETAKEQIDG